jgi:dinuclear metal center YbgI/SA1388 family protein
MLTIGAILDELEKLAPLETKLDFDNVGLLAGDPNWEVSTVLLSLDITSAVIREAEELDAGLVISHHPLFFTLNAAVPGNAGGKHTLELLTRRIGAICMHTNLDAADGGVNDALARRLGLLDAQPYEPEHICRIGHVRKPVDLAEFLGTVKTALGCEGLRYVQGTNPVFQVAVGGGSCGSMLEDAVLAGCDTFVTADVKHDVFLRASELGINLIDAGHFHTENVVIPVLKNVLDQAFPGLNVRISAHTAAEHYYL